MEYAPDVLPALSQTQLISYHTASTLQASLQSKECISCGQFGFALFLPTCERCCYACLYRNQSLWVIPKSFAAKCFRLTPRQLNSLPVMLNIPGTYSVGRDVSTSRITIKRRRKPVSVGAAKDLGIKTHGSIKNIADSTTCHQTKPVSRKVIRRIQWFQEAPLQPLDQDPNTIPWEHETPDDKYCGMASIPFPSVRPGEQPELGLWCRGCEWTYMQYASEHEYKIEKILGAGQSRDYIYHMPWILKGDSDRARSTAEFSEHIKDCYGAREMGSVCGAKALSR